MNTTKNTPTFGPILEATMRAQDVIPALCNELIARGKQRELDRILQAAHEQWPSNEETGAYTMGAALLRPSTWTGSRIAADDSAAWWSEDLDNGSGWSNHDENTHTIGELMEALNEGLPEGMEFSTHPDDPASLGYWEVEVERYDPTTQVWDPNGETH